MSHFAIRARSLILVARLGSAQNVCITLFLFLTRGIFSSLSSGDSCRLVLIVVMHYDSGLVICALGLKSHICN